MNYTLTIKLETAVSPASGESWGSYVDNDVIYDEFGLPFIPARRIKGILAESAIDIYHLLDRKNILPNVKITEESVRSLFGNAGEDRSCPLKIDSAYLKDYTTLREWFVWAREVAPEYVTPQQVLSLFTTTRSQTAIAPGNSNEAQPGVADEHSLRIHRILNRGWEFQSVIELPNKEYLPLLALAAQISRSLGLGRNRGLGGVKMTLSSPTVQDIAQSLKREANNG